MWRQGRHSTLGDGWMGFGVPVVKDEGSKVVGGRGVRGLEGQGEELALICSQHAALGLAAALGALLEM